MKKTETLAVRRKILSDLLDSVDEFGFAQCPGQHLHTSKDGQRDFRVFGIEGKKMFGSCFHSSCQEAVEAFNDKLQEKLILSNAHYWPWAEEGEDDPDRVVKKRRKKVAPNEKLIKDVVDSVPAGVDRSWLRKQSPVNVDEVDAHKFLSCLYPEPTDRVLIFRNEASQGQLIWEARLPETWQRMFATGCPKGVWFLIQPVTGTYKALDRLKTSYNPQGLSRRSAENVTSFRYLVLESDNIDEGSWIRILASLPLPVVSVTTSGSRSLHAIVWVGAANQQEWEDFRYNIEGLVASLGCDQGALKAVQLSRLPGCMRYVKFDKESGADKPLPGGPAKQELLYLNPHARSATPLWTPKTH